ncbi:MAG: MBL fold metallo-hydrolase, partial [Dehalococcoidia bacterium]
MTQTTISLPEVDEVKITTIVDNSIDLLMAGTEVAHRHQLGPNPFERSQPVAEHGFSVLITVKRQGKQGAVLFDTGLSQKGFLHNLDALEINTTGIQAIVLSHGHPDHAMGLLGVFDRLGKRRLPLVLHPDAYLERKLVLPD